MIIKKIKIKNKQKSNYRPVPCNGCFACCQMDAIYIHPECGDLVQFYKTEHYEGKVILQHKQNGDCIYLDREVGCTIYNSRPWICHSLDCRQMYKKLKYHKNIGLYMQPDVVKAAKRLLKKKRKGF